MPELAPSLPSDTLEATQPADSFPADSLEGDSSTSQADPDAVFPDEAPVTPADSAALRELKTWIQSHPGSHGAASRAGRAGAGIGRAG